MKYVTDNTISMDINKLLVQELSDENTYFVRVPNTSDKEYDEKEFCYKGNGYYVVNARRHLYSLGMPEDYGYSKVYRMDELPMFPIFELSAVHIFLFKAVFCKSENF